MKMLKLNENDNIPNELIRLLNNYSASICKLYNGSPKYLIIHPIIKHEISCISGHVTTLDKIITYYYDNGVFIYEDLKYDIFGLSEVILDKEFVNDFYKQYPIKIDKNDYKFIANLWDAYEEKLGDVANDEYYKLTGMGFYRSSVPEHIVELLDEYFDYEIRGYCQVDIHYDYETHTYYYTDYIGRLTRNGIDYTIDQLINIYNNETNNK